MRDSVASLKDRIAFLENEINKITGEREFFAQEINILVSENERLRGRIRALVMLSAQIQQVAMYPKSMSQGQTFHGDVPLSVAIEMAAVGAIPSTDAYVGEVFTLHNSKFKIMKEITRQEFLEKVHAAGFDKADFAICPEKYKFWEISGD